MGGSRPGSPNIVLHDHDLIFELYPDHSVVTNLFNYTLPLIRYRMADILRPVDSGVHAPYLVIESLVGRNELQPVFKTRDGGEDFISPHTINEIFVAGVTRFQMHLSAPRRSASWSASTRRSTRSSARRRSKACPTALREILARKRMDNVRFEVLAVDDLPVNPRTRKFQLIVDKRARERAPREAKGERTMALQVIGAGLGRTGTLSLKLALEQLGLGPCYHMAELMMNPERAPLWIAAADGKPDWDADLQGLLVDDRLSRVPLLARARGRVPEGEADPHEARQGQVVRIHAGDDLFGSDDRADSRHADRAVLREDDLEGSRRRGSTTARS